MLSTVPEKTKGLFIRIFGRNLEKNNLSGSIPSALVEKSKEGSLTLRYMNLTQTTQIHNMVA